MQLLIVIWACILALCARGSRAALLEGYRGLLATHPLRTNMVTASILSVASDAIAQSVERRNAALVRKKQPLHHQQQQQQQPQPLQGHDFKRSLAMGVYGAGVFGAFVSEWFKILSRLVPVGPGDWKGVILKVGVNQFFMSPFLNTLFFSWVTFTRSSSSSLSEKASTLKRKLNQDLKPTILRSLVYWSTWNLASFGIVPPKYLVVTTNLGFLLWTIYVSMVGYRTVQE